MGESNGRPAWISDVLAMEGRLLTRIDRLEDATNRRLDALEERFREAIGKLDERVSDLERDRARWSLPRSTLLSGLKTLLAALIGGLVGRFIR